MTRLLFFLCLIVLVKFSNAQVLPEPTFWLIHEQGQGFQNVGQATLQTPFIDSLTNIDPVALNFNPAYTFPQANFELGSSRIPLSQSKFTVFVVYRADSLTDDVPVYSLQDNDKTVLALSPKKVIRYGRHLVYRDSITTKTVINVAEGQVRGNFSGGLSLQIGHVDSSFFRGWLGELILFEGKLDQITRENYETYLALKYGVTLESDHYLMFADTSKVWVKAENQQFHHDVIGVGIDSTLGLKQYQSINEVLSFAADTLRFDNLHRLSDLQEGRSVIIGSTRGNLASFSPDTLPGNVVMACSNKKFRVKLSHNDLSMNSFHVKFHTSALSGRDSLILIIQKDSNSTPDFYLADSIDAHGDMHFHLSFDSDGSGEDLFFFAKDLNSTTQALRIASGFGPKLEDGAKFWNEMQVENSRRGNGLTVAAFPNPVGNEFNIKVSSKATAPVELTITDMLGRICFHQHLTGQFQYLLEHLTLSKGTYAVIAKDETSTQFTKLIVF
jgi:hypothetical protein